MLSLLLNWRVLAGLALVVAQCVFGTIMYTEGEKSVQVAFDEYKNEQILNTLAAESAARQKEHTLQSENYKVSQDYDALKSNTTAAISNLAAERVRLQATIATLHRATGGAPAPGPIADAPPEDRVLGECVSRRTEVAGDAQSLSDQVTGLQRYVNTVVFPPQSK